MSISAGEATRRDWPYFGEKAPLTSALTALMLLATPRMRTSAPTTTGLLMMIRPAGARPAGAPGRLIRA